MTASAVPGPAPASLPELHARFQALLPRVELVEPLRLEAEHFLDCIRMGKEPATGITHARTVVSILERADAAHSGKAT